jgi:hypothetical protein
VSAEPLALACALGEAAQHALGVGMSADVVRKVQVSRLWYPDTHDAVAIYG